MIHFLIALLFFKCFGGINELIHAFNQLNSALVDESLGFTKTNFVLFKFTSNIVYIVVELIDFTMHFSEFHDSLLISTQSCYACVQQHLPELHAR